MSGSSNPPTWQTWLKPGSANKTFAVTALFALIAIGSWLYWQQSQVDPRISLLPGAKLLEHDLGRIQLAFGDSGLNDYEIREGQIWVPRSLRDRFLKAINVHDASPESSREIYEPNPQSPWATSQQQRESNLLHKKKTIRQLVLQLEFVADAIVDYDELVDGNWPPTTRRSVAIVVRPKGGRLMESFQVDAIRNTICGAVAGLKPSEIVITDIVAGHAYVGSAATEVASADSATLIRLERAKLEQRIGDQLSQFGSGIEAFVTFEERENVTSNSAAPLRVAVNVGTPTAIANQPTVIKTDSTNDQAATHVFKDEYPSITLRIRIPEKCVREFSQPNAVAANDMSGISDTLEQDFESLELQIKAAIQPLLAAGPVHWTRKQIDVSMIRTPLETDASLGVTMPWSTWSKYIPAGAIGLGVIALFALMFRRAKPTARRLPSDEPISVGSRTSRESIPLHPTADSIPDETRRKLKQMVDDDPDQAAEIIKQWIRGAA